MSSEYVLSPLFSGNADNKTQVSLHKNDQNMSPNVKKGTVFPAQHFVGLYTRTYCNNLAILKSTKFISLRKSNSFHQTCLSSYETTVGISHKLIPY